jgi:hypothetical protein
MLTDRELLERAAKAAGYAIVRHPNSRVLPSLMFMLDERLWNPLTDDGDALRLAVKLNLWEPVMFGRRAEIGPDGDIYAATRRAIVRAAAALADSEPVQTIIALKSDEQASLSPGAYQVLTSAVRPSAEPVDDGPDAKRFTAKQLHAIKLRGYQDAEAVMRQALDALRVVHTTVNNYGNGTERGELLNAIDALRAALGEK